MNASPWLTERDRLIAAATLRWEEAQARTNLARAVADRAWAKAVAASRSQEARSREENVAFDKMMEALRPGWRSEDSVQPEATA